MSRPRMSSTLAVFGLLVPGLSSIASAQPEHQEVAAYSTTASNIGPAGSRSVVAPTLPSPPVPSAAPPQSFLRAARSAVERGRSGEAQEALERAETRLLDRSADPARANLPNNDRVVLDIAVARRFLAARDRMGALRAIDDALQAESILPAAAVQPLPPGRPVPLLPEAAQPAIEAVPPAPVTTYALLPGHWQLQGAAYEWIPPETTLRRVEYHQLVPGQYVWRSGTWTWVPSHYER